MRKVLKLLLVVLLSTVTLFHSDVAISDSEKGLKKQKMMYGITGAVFTGVAAYDTYTCVQSEGEAPGMLIGINSCVEAGVSAALAVVAFVQMAKVDKDRKKQLGKTGPGPGKAPPKGPKGCLPEEEEVCKKLKKYTSKIKRKDCNCTPANPVVNMKGEVTDPLLAANIPDDIEAAIKEAVEKEDPSIIDKALKDSGEGGDIGSFAVTDPAAFESALNSNKGAADFFDSAKEEGKSEGEEEKEKDVAFGGEGGAAGKEGLIGPQTQLGAVEGRLGGKDKGKKKDDKSGKLKITKGSGVIADSKRGLFAAVTRRYGALQQDEYDAYLLKREGKYTSIKYIPDEATVKQAVEETKLQKKKKSSLSEEIQKFEE